MNRFILKHKYLVTFAILAVIAWAARRQFSAGGSVLITYAAVAAIVWALGTLVFIYYWPRITYTGFKRAITKGVDANTSSGIPINTLYAVPTIVAPSASSASILTTGTDYLLYVLGWLDLSRGAQVLHVPDFSGRYYSMQFSDPSDGAAFAYVGTRTTGTAAGDYLLTGANWNGQVPSGVTQIPSPNNAVAVIGRVLVESESDLPPAYGLAKQIRLTPLSRVSSDAAEAPS
jgi:hypothetical protein